MKAGTRLLVSLSLCAAVTALAATLTTQFPQAAGKATIQTDLADYPPDTQVNVTGSGWLAGEVVQLTFTETSTTPPGGYTDGPFVFYATADGQGNIANGEFHTDEHDLGVHFLLTAKGAITGRTAQTTFTDNLPGLFQIDGNATGGTTNSHDWDQVWSDRVNGTHVAGTGSIQFTVDGVNSKDDDTFSNSPKDTQDITAWKWGKKAVSSPKTDLAHGFAAAYQDSGYSNYGSTHTLLFVGTDRYASGSNSAISIWFLQHPIGQKADGTFENKANHTAETHQVGDLLIQASLGSTTSVNAYKWVGGANPLQLISLSSAEEIHAINLPTNAPPAGTISVPWGFIDSTGSTSPLTQEFFEVGLDLNEVFQATSENLPDFSSFIITTRTSTSQTATLSDFILGNVSSAPDVAVSKKADAATVNAGGQVGYTVSVSNAGVGNLTGITLNDPLPPGAGGDLNWSLAGDSTSGVFQITGSQGSQTLSFIAPQNLAFNSAALVAHVVATSTNSDAGTLSNTATVAAPNEGGDFLSNNTSTAVITINRLNGLPVANAQSVETNEETAKNITLTGDDGDAGLTQTLTFAIASYPANGTLSGFDPATGAVTYTPDANYNGPDSFTFTVTDEATSGGPAMTSAPATVSITVKPVNDAPANVVVNSDTLDENDVYDLSGSFTDSDSGDSHTVTINWGDGSTTVIPSFAGLTFAASHQYLDDNASDSYTVTVTVQDNGGATGTGGTTVTVKNAAPIVLMSTSTIVLSPGDAFSRPGSFFDAGTVDTWSATVNYDDGTGPHNLTLTAEKTFQLESPAYTAGVHKVTVTVTDDDGGAGTMFFYVSVGTPPAITAVGPQTGAKNVELTQGFSFTGTSTTGYTSSINWGDASGAGNVQTDSLTTDGTFNGSHTYTHKGTYTVFVTVTDSGTGVSGTISFTVTVS
jgi:uncharacterized repeat protein (TIGR01451 family)